MNKPPRATPVYVLTCLFVAASLLACAPAKDSGSKSKLIGNWQGKDPYDQSNISIQISTDAGQQYGQFTVKASDDKTTPDWCGVDATATATASLDGNQALNVNLLWVCNNANKTSQGFPTVITYNSSNDTITAYGTSFTRVK
jgi:FlaG/FlaF family flagellin (archaellin)